MVRGGSVTKISAASNVLRGHSALTAIASEPLLSATGSSLIECCRLQEPERLNGSGWSDGVVQEALTRPREIGKTARPQVVLNLRITGSSYLQQGLALGRRFFSAASEGDFRYKTLGPIQTLKRGNSECKASLTSGAGGCSM
ncbi:MAG: hypothetical protein AMS21_10675 [Gemmatimonas sp. SG8_38_2]|nr:MAG: hypothetical protein AMS21_10675 [Gemmatimonas sp. SG8_38_2]